MTDEAIRILKNQKKKNQQLKTVEFIWKNFVFLNRVGRPTSTQDYDLTLKRLCKTYHLPHISMHILRHTFATRCIEGGMLPKTLQSILGHSSIMMTMNLYVHATCERKELEMQKVSNTLKAM